MDIMVKVKKISRKLLSGKWTLVFIENRYDQLVSLINYPDVFFFSSGKQKAFYY